MKFIPILYSTAMVQAKLAKNKTQTRRTRGLNKLNYEPNKWKIKHTNWDISRGKLVFTFVNRDNYLETETILCPYGVPDDILWTRETYANLNADIEKIKPYYVYKADLGDGIDYGPVTWKPNIHMPKTACRMWDKVISIWPERLQDITEADAVAEGVETLGYYPGYEVSSRGKFEGLWNSLNGPNSFDANHWVWRIEYEPLAEMPEGFI
jgi:hypothetical protein